MNHLQTKVETLGQATESTNRTATFQGISRQRIHLPAMVLGVRVHGPDVVDVEVKLDETFRSVPVPEKLGIPVLYKTQSGTGGVTAIICDLLKIEMHQMPIGTHGTHSIFHFLVLLLGESQNIYILIYSHILWYSFVCAYIPHCQFPLVWMVKSGIFVGEPQSPMFLDVKSSVFIVPFQFHSSFRWVQIISSHFKSLQHVQKFLNIPSLHPKTTQSRRGDDSDIRSNVIVRFMADTSDGLAPAEWQYGGRQGPAPPVVLARKDQVGNAKVMGGWNMLKPEPKNFWFTW